MHTRKYLRSASSHRLFDLVYFAAARVIRLTGGGGLLCWSSALDRHECLRVFQDRLIDEQEKQYVDEHLIGKIMQELFPDHAEAASRNPILWGDFKNALNILQMSENPATEVGQELHDVQLG